MGPNMLNACSLWRSCEACTLVCWFNPKWFMKIWLLKSTISVAWRVPRAMFLVYWFKTLSNDRRLYIYIMSYVDTSTGNPSLSLAISPSKTHRNLSFVFFPNGFPNSTFPLHPFNILQPLWRSSSNAIPILHGNTIGSSPFPVPGSNRFPTISAASEPISLTTLKHTCRSCERSTPATWNSTCGEARPGTHWKPRWDSCGIQHGIVGFSVWWTSEDEISSRCTGEAKERLEEWVVCQH